MCHETCAGQTRQLRHIEANGKAFTNPIKNSEPDGAMLKAFWGGLRPFRNQVIFDQADDTRQGRTAINNRGVDKQPSGCLREMGVYQPFQVPLPPKGFERGKQPLSPPRAVFRGGIYQFPGRNIVLLVASGAPRGSIRFTRGGP